jgi:hypothetical protein
VDAAAMRARLAALIPSEPYAGEAADAMEPIAIADDASWIRAPGEEVRRLDGRGPLKRVLLCLVEAHRDAPGRRLPPDVLLEAGWPGERPLREAGLNRVYVAVSMLRKLGLRGALERDDAGYRIAPRARVVMEDAGTARAKR